MKKISVIIPAYNAEKHLEDAILSVLAQTFQAFEIIVVDDGSIDNTAKVAKKYDVKYLYQENEGASAARNRGIKAADGDYVAFLDSDDLWMPGKLEKQVALLRNSNYGMIYCDMSHVVEGKTIYKSYLRERKYKFVGSGKIFQGLLQENFIFTPTVLIKREVIDIVGGFDEHYKICEDYKMWLKIAENHEMGFIDEPLVVRRRHEGNITKDKFLHIQSALSLFKELAINIHDTRLKKIAQRELGKRFFEMGYYYWNRGELDNARSNFIEAASNNSFKAAPYLLAGYLPQSFINTARGLKRCLR